MAPTISVLGCGWLGFPLAKSLLNQGFLIKGTTTTQSKMGILKKAKIEPFLIELNQNSTKENSTKINSFLKESTILIINIPPKLRKQNSESFVDKMIFLIPFIENSKIENVLFVSSTSVYGNNLCKIDENSITNPETESGKQLLEVEKLLQNNSNFKTTIIRFGGLIGEDRNPIHFLAGKENIENPNTPINLIHQKDCIGIVTAIIDQNCWGVVFNAVAPFHPSRKTYYTQKAIELGLPLPQFSSNQKNNLRIISSLYLKPLLNYSFQELSS